jgi:membrane-spanning protein
MVTPSFIWKACVPSFAKPRCDAANRPQLTENPEEGSGTVLAVGIIAALLILATVIIGFAGVSTANRRGGRGGRRGGRRMRCAASPLGTLAMLPPK